MEAIILAGGLGTRLRSEIAELPKCMAPIKGIPFIDFIIVYLKREGVKHFIFSLGYKSEVVIEYLDATFPDLNKTYVVETEPLGTGGAIKKASKEAKGENVIVINGDTYFNVHLPELIDLHLSKKASCTLALKELTAFDRYGSIELDNDNNIISFKEKQYCEKGFINGGIYILNITSLKQKEFPEKFSFEKEYLEQNVGNFTLIGKPYKNYFIDIGIPEDYHRFENDYEQRAKWVNDQEKPKDGENFIGFILEILTAFE